MTSIPTIGDGSQPRQWSISNRTLVVSAGGERVLAVLNGREPLLLPPGSVLQFGDPLGQLVVTKVGVIVGEPGQYPVLSRLDHPTQRAGYLRPVPSQLPQSSGVRPPVTANASTRHETSGLHQMPAELDADFRTPRQKQLARRLRTVT